MSGAAARTLFIRKNRDKECKYGMERHVIKTGK